MDEIDELSIEDIEKGVTQALIKKLTQTHAHSPNITVRLKYDDTHSDQQFFEIDTILPHPVETPTQGPLNAHEMPPHCVEPSPQCMETPTKRPHSEGV